MRILCSLANPSQAVLSEDSTARSRTPESRRLRAGLPDPRASVLECGCRRQPSAALACRTVVHPAHQLPTRSNSGESAPLHRRTPKRRRIRTGTPESRASVLECGCGRQPSTAFACRTGVHPAHQPHTRSKAAKSLRSIAALQNVADFARGFPILAPASWSAVVGEALHRFRMPEHQSPTLRPALIQKALVEPAGQSYAGSPTSCALRLGCGRIRSRRRQRSE
jgi:hypothetical protein